MSKATGSGLLDQLLIEDIARNCPQEYLGFHQCMAKQTPESDFCSAEQYNLAACIKKKVPTFQSIQNLCSGKLQAYEACLRTSGSKKRCEGELKVLRECATGSLSK